MIRTIDLHFQGMQHTTAVFLLETSAGLVLIETGPHSTLPAVEQVLRNHGYALPDVHAVFLTHIHLDHAGAAWVFAQNGAAIYVHPVGERHLAEPSRLMDSARRIYRDKMDSLWGEMHAIPAGKLHTVEDGAAVVIGDQTFIAHHTPGHAVHHIAWQVGEVLFTGDVAGVKIDAGPTVPPCPPPDINIEHWLESIARIRRLQPARLFLTHFGAIEKPDIESHLQALEMMLHDWAGWMKPRYLSGQDPAEITPEFTAYAERQLLEMGVSAEVVQQYEAANPAWMSVAGLLRYWKKRDAE